MNGFFMFFMAMARAFVGSSEEALEHLEYHFMPSGEASKSAL